MSDRTRKITNLPRGERPTARSRIATALAGEILDSSSAEPFPIASEYQLCRRFGVSRVTVRLALEDLKNRGLLYRKHGVGTFAHGRSTRNHRHLGILITFPLQPNNPRLIQILNGAHAFALTVNSTVVLIGQPPHAWSNELSRMLAGVIVIADDVSADDLINLGNRNLPFLLLNDTDLPGVRLSQDTAHELPFSIGRRAAEMLYEAFLTGNRGE
jgi:hypothetical protein